MKTDWSGDYRVFADLLGRQGSLRARALLCAMCLVAIVPSHAQAEEAAAAAKPAEAVPAAGSPSSVPERGIQRSGLLQRLLGGDAEILLEQRAERQPDVTEAVRLDEAVAFALKNNFEVKASYAKKEASGWEVAGAYGAYLPTVTFVRSSGQEISSPASYSDGVSRVAKSEHHRRDKTLSIRQPLVDLSLISDILLRHERLSAAEAEGLGVRERVALQTVNAFFKIVRARLSMGFAQKYKAQLDNLTELMSSRVEGGGAAQADLERVKTRSVTAQAAIIETRSEYDSAMDEFRRLTGITPLKLQIPSALVPVLPQNVDEALEKALKGNPDYLLSLQQVEVQKQESDKAYSRLLPKLTFEYTKSRSWNAGGAALGIDAASGDEVYPYQNESRAMLTASWAITGGTEIAEGLAAGAKAREANFKSMDTRMRLEEGVRLSFNALNAANNRLPVVQQAMESSAKVVEAFQEQYINANRPLFDLLDAYDRQYQAQLDMARLLVSEAQAGHQLRRQMGELVPALKETEPRAQPAKD